VAQRCSEKTAPLVRNEPAWLTAVRGARRRHIQEAVVASSSSDSVEVTLTVNGCTQALKVDPRSTLLDVLRERLS
jgi:hypothetical protein